MTRPFAPTFRHFQDDVERYLKAQGTVEKNEHGQTVFRGYQPAVTLMYRTYIEKGAYAPLVTEFRGWNYEWSYDEHLLELTSHLLRVKDWALLERLWSGVIAKRRTNYNKTKQAQKAVPDKVSMESVAKTRDLLLESLRRVEGYAKELGRSADVGAHVEMMRRVERGLKA